MSVHSLVQDTLPLDDGSCSPIIENKIEKIEVQIFHFTPPLIRSHLVHSATEGNPKRTQKEEEEEIMRSYSYYLER